MPEERTIGRGGSVGKKPGQAFDGVTTFVRVVRPDQDAKQTRLDLTHSQILAYRRTVNALDTCLPPGPQSLRVAAWAGLTDSMPRAALLSIHARVAGTQASALEDPSLVQLWGRGSAPTWSRRPTPRCSPLGGCRTMAPSVE